MAFLDIGIASAQRERGVELKHWRYYAEKKRFLERELRVVETTERCATDPFDPRFVWHRTRFGSARFLLELYELERAGWRTEVRKAHGDERLTIVVSGRSRYAIVLPRAFPFEPPLVLAPSGEPSWPNGFVWSSLRTLAGLLARIEEDL